jgi:hypothetical protein
MPSCDHATIGQPPEPLAPLSMNIGEAIFPVHSIRRSAPTLSPQDDDA